MDKNSYNVRIRQFHYWQKKIRDYILEHPDISADDLCDPGHCLPNTQDSPSFYKLSYRQVSSLQEKNETFTCRPLQSTAHSQASPLMLQFDRFRLYIGDGFTESTLSSVIKVIKNA